MYFLETTIVVSDDENHKFVLTELDHKYDLTLGGEVTLMTDSANLKPTSGPTRVRQQTTPSITSPFLAPSDLSVMNSFGGDLMTTDLTPPTSTYTFPSASPTLSAAEQKANREKETKNVILGSILGGVLGFATFAILIFCVLTYIGGRHGNKRRRRLNRKRRNSMSSNHNTDHSSQNSFRRFLRHESNSNTSAFSQSSPDIPINSSPVPYADSPFESQEILRFKPADPRNTFSKHEKLPVQSEHQQTTRFSGTQPDFLIGNNRNRSSDGSSTIPKLISYSDEDLIGTQTLSIEPPRTSQLNTEYIERPESCAQQSIASSHASSIYSPPVAYEPNTVSRYDPFNDQEPTLSAPASSAVTPPYLRTPFPRKVSNARKNMSAASSIHDDGRGEYTDLFFDEKVFDVDQVQTPDIPPVAVDQRRQMVIKKKSLQEETLAKISLHNSLIKVSGKPLTPASAASKTQSLITGTPTANRQVSNDLNTANSGISSNLYEDYILFSSKLDNAK